MITQGIAVGKEKRWDRWGEGEGGSVWRRRNGLRRREGEMIRQTPWRRSATEGLSDARSKNERKKMCPHEAG